MRRGRGLPSAALAVVARPRLWTTALRQARSLTPPRWWRRRPFLPLPDRDWLAFRLTTAYGDASAPVRADDLVVWLDWSKRQRAVSVPGVQTPGPRAGAPR